MFSRNKDLALSGYSICLRLISVILGLSVALTVLVLLSGCASQSKPLPMYQQVEVFTVKAYQDKVNHTQNYVYRTEIPHC